VFALGWFLTMSTSFGESHAEEFSVGDIVEWSIWNTQEEEWQLHYGVLLAIENEIRSNRLVSISKVMPLHTPGVELEFFTMGLRLVSHKEDVDIDI